MTIFMNYTDENQAIELDAKKKEISFINSRASEAIILEIQHTFPWRNLCKQFDRFIGVTS
jgi:hypothetical protein